jgi:tRNA pseudouridine55 synthase
MSPTDASPAGRRSNELRPSGVLVIDKPRGPTSHDVVATLRRALRTREIGHAGTLDPMATGVLVVCVGEATKLAPWLTAADKAYQATIALGAETDTLDAEGTVTKRSDVPRSMLDALEELKTERVHEHIEAALANERARTLQVPPAVSAIRKDGVRSYTRARAGEEVEHAPRPVSARAIALLDGGADADGGAWVALRCDVSKGYYVRSLARDFAASLGTLGHLTSLRRTRSGPFVIDESLPLDTPSDELSARMIALEHAASRALPTATLTENGERDARFGRAVRSEDFVTPAAEGAQAWLAPDGALVAVGERDATGVGKVIRGFARLAAP